MSNADSSGTDGYFTSRYHDHTNVLPPRARSEPGAEQFFEVTIVGGQVGKPKLAGNGFS